MSNNIYLKKGLDLPINGKAAQNTRKVIVPDVVAVKPTDFRGLVPKLLVREGDKVLAGTPVLADKMSQNILFASPVSGTVAEVVRGEKRKLLEVRIKADEKQEYVDFGAKKVSSLSAEQIKESLLAAGLWPASLRGHTESSQTLRPSQRRFSYQHSLQHLSLPTQSMHSTSRLHMCRQPLTLSASLQDARFMYA